MFELGQRQAGEERELRDVSENAPDSWWEDEGFPLVPTETIKPDEVHIAEVREAGGRASLRNLDRALDLTP